MSDEAQTPVLRRVVEAIIEEKLAVLEGPGPGRVVAYDDDRQSASIQPLIHRIFEDEEGNSQSKLRPIIQDVPVLFFGGGESRITYGVKVGDLVLIVPCSSSIARWLVRGGEIDPGQARGSTRDAVALAGLHHYRDVPTTAPDALVLHGNDVRLGGADANDPVVRRSDLNQLIATYHSHVHLVTTSGTATTQSGTTLITAMTQAPLACSPTVSSK